MMGLGGKIKKSKIPISFLSALFGLGRSISEPICKDQPTMALQQPSIVNVLTWSRTLRHFEVLSWSTILRHFEVLFWSGIFRRFFWYGCWANAWAMGEKMYWTIPYTVFLLSCVILILDICQLLWIYLNSCLDLSCVMEKVFVTTMLNKTILILESCKKNYFFGPHVAPICEPSPHIFSYFSPFRLCMWTMW